MFFMVLKQLQDPYYQGVAAQVAFFFMLSIVPTLILLSHLLGFVNLSLDNLTEFFEIELAPDIFNSLQALLRFESQASTNIVLILAAVWAASRLQFTLLRVANYTLTNGRDAGTFVRDRVRSIVTIMLTVIIIVLMIVFLIYGQIAIHFFHEKLAISTLVKDAWKYLRWPIAGGLYFLLITFNYYVLPRDRGRIRDVLPGSIFCALGMLIVTSIYSYYTTSAVTNNILYGSMASIAALMFWFYFVSWVLILGIFVNKVWKDTK